MSAPRVASPSRVILVTLLMSLTTACGTARPQTPTSDPDHGVIPAGPPAPIAGQVTPGSDPAVDPVVAPTTPTTPTTTTPVVDPALTPTTPTVAPAPVLSPDQAYAALIDACTQGSLLRCAGAVSAADPLELAPEARARVVLEQARLAAWNAVDTSAIGVLLPLSGPYAKFGEAAKEAIDLVLAEDGGTTIRLVVRDTEGDADKAAAAATDLILHERVAVLLGPIGRKESAAVANVARLYAVPALPLTSEVPPPAPPAPATATTTITPTPDPDPVLRLRTSPSELVAAIARHARTELGVERVALLVPSNNDGAREAADAFKVELERLGGTVVREVVFDATAKDFAEPLKALLPTAAPPPTPSKKSHKTSKPKLDFDALFIPADAVVVRRLVPFLAYWGFQPRTAVGDKSRVQLLGAAGWNHPAVVDKGEHLTNNAVFADVFAADDPDAQDFGRRFFLRLQRRPTAFHAEVWDATRLVVDALGGLAHDVAHALDRVSVRDALLAPRVLVGATGTIALVVSAGGGRFEPRAHLLTIDGDEIRRRFSEDEERARRTNPTPPEGAPTTPDPAVEPPG